MAEVGGSVRQRWWLLVPLVAAAACAETAGAGPEAPRAARPGPSRLELAPVYAVPMCPSPFPLAQVQVSLVTGEGRRPMNERRDDLGRPLFGTQASFGQLSPELTYYPPMDVLPFLGRSLIVDVSYGALTGRLTVPARYDCPQFVNLAGRSGREGHSGGRGEDGEPGPRVRIGVGYITGPKGEPLVIVRIDDGTGIRARTVFQPDGPPLQVFLDGGPGGPGGEPISTRNGWGVSTVRIPGGPGGDGGDGGAAEIGYDQAFPELERKIAVYNRGGVGGGGPEGAGRPGRPGAIPRSVGTSATSLFSDEIARGFPIKVPTPVPAADRAI
jgi:hypothetical protein